MAGSRKQWQKQKKWEDGAFGKVKQEYDQAKKDGKRGKASYLKGKMDGLAWSRDMYNFKNNPKKHADDKKKTRGILG